MMGDIMVGGKRRAAMEEIVRAVLACLLILTASNPGWSAQREGSNSRTGPALTKSTNVTPPAGHGWPQVTLVIDFADYAGGSIEAWLQAKGFRLEHGARDPASLALSSEGGALVLEAKKPVWGFVVNDDVKLEHFSKIRITWGIIKYPKGASYERNVHNEALMLYISFGQDHLASGHVVIPARPYFIGLFLGQEAKLNTPYKGKYFHAGGRYVCVGNPQPYETVRSEFDLRTAFQTYFDKVDVPMISGISLGVDTFNSGDKGTAAAYIHRIEFLE
jgi:hypothetical protein